MSVLSRRMQGVPDKDSVNRVIHKLGLEPHKQKKAKNLSLGNKQRLGLAKAMIHNPEILILDEPINGLDPAGVAEIRNMLYYHPDLTASPYKTHDKAS